MTISSLSLALSLSVPCIPVLHVLTILLQSLLRTRAVVEHDKRLANVGTAAHVERDHDSVLKMGIDLKLTMKIQFEFELFNFTEMRERDRANGTTIENVR